MRLKSLFKWMLVGVLGLVAFIPSVFATWSYSYLPAGNKGVEVSNSLIEFFYKPEELLPSDDEAVNMHENHLALIENIVNHIDYGLNATKKPIVKRLLLERKTVVYSDENVQGGNLKHMMLTNDSENLMFVVQYVSDTEFSAYTFSGREADYAHMDAYISVYKTQILYENGRWKAVRSFTGQAKVFRPQYVSLSINVDTWVKT